MLFVGEDPKKYINDYSNQFQRDFLQLLRTSHGEKKVQLNHFYQEYIDNKEHVHELYEMAQKGIHVAWIDNSPEALRRQGAIKKKERQDKGDEEREQMLVLEEK
jgi:DNA/RNA-binding protein KIN17